MQNVTIEPMQDTDRDAVHQLLRGHRLPLEGFDDAHVVRIVARQGDAVIGSAAIERYGSFGLLRSVAVEQSNRGRSLGSHLTREALALARRLGMTAVYLLTETAATFFPRFGFVPVSRAEIPESVKGSVEFTTACPATAAAFVAYLPPEPRQ